MDTTSLLVDVKGTSYRNSSEINAARLLDVGDSLILQKESDNCYDDFAVRVFTRNGFCIGYVDRKFSQYVSEHISFIESCSVFSSKLIDTPFISLEIKFSSHPQPLPCFESNQENMTASERMMILSSIAAKQTANLEVSSNLEVPSNEEYAYIEFWLAWTDELPRKNIQRALACVCGEHLVLKLPSEQRYPGRIEVYSRDEVLIGYIDEDCHPGISDIIEQIISPKIVECHSSDRIKGCFYIPSDLMLNLPDSKPYVFNYPYKEVEYAQTLSKKNPQAALDILSYAIAHEKGIVAKEVAASCYYKLKDWEKRKTMCLHMIQVIDSLSEGDMNPAYLSRLKRYERDCLAGSVAYCDKRLNAINKKKQ